MDLSLWQESLVKGTGLQGAIAASRIIFFASLRSCGRIPRCVEQSPQSILNHVPLFSREGSRDCQFKCSFSIWYEIALPQIRGSWNRDIQLNIWLHHSGYFYQAEFTNPCLIWCLINSLSSCVYREGIRYMVCKEMGCVFEVDFSKSLEEFHAWGRTRLLRENRQLL